MMNTIISFVDTAGTLQLWFINTKPFYGHMFVSEYNTDEW